MFSRNELDHMFTRLINKGTLETGSGRFRKSLAALSASLRSEPTSLGITLVDSRSNHPALFLR